MRFNKLFVLLLLGLVRLSANGQDLDWSTYVSDSKDFSVCLPGSIEVISEKDKITLWDPKVGPLNSMSALSDLDRNYMEKGRFLIASAGTSTFMLATYHLSDTKEAKELALAQLSPKGTYTAFTAQNFSGRAITTTTPEHQLLHLIVASKNRAYHLIAASRIGLDPAFKLVMTSVKLQGQSIYTVESKPTDESIQAEAVKAIPEVLISALQDTTFSFQTLPDGLPKSTETDKKTGQSEKPSRSLMIVSKPRARYTDKARRNNVTGKIVLRIELKSNGKVGSIAVVGKGLDGGLNENAVRAARLVRFLPEEIEGKPVTTYKTFEYSFEIY